ncbi:MAG: hypothetical protein ACFCAD_12205 [Pleurocapsa sp.]
MSEHRLDKIVIERPRMGMRISSQKSIRKQIKQQLQQEKYDYQESEIGSLKPCYKEAVRGIRSKYFSDHLSPLYKWLRSKVGQPWDNIYTELAQLLEFNTLSGQHILVHVWQFVAREVVIIDDVPYNMAGYYPLGHWRRGGELYVHPETGILSLAKPQPKTKPKQRQDYFWINRYHQYYKLNDILYLVYFRLIPEPFMTSKGKTKVIKVRDVLQQKIVDYSKLTNNSSIYAYHKRQCNKKEIRWIEEQIEVK